MKKFISLVITSILALSLATTNVFATYHVPYARSVSVRSTSQKVTIGRNVWLDFQANPKAENRLIGTRTTTNSGEDKFEYDKYVWSSADPSIADVDDYGEVTGYKTGKVTLRVDLYMTNKVTREEEECGHGEIELEVVESLINASNTSIKPVETNTTATFKPTNTKNIGTQHVLDSVKRLVVPGKTTGVTYKNVSSISGSTLYMAADLMRVHNGVVLLTFDNMFAETPDKVEGRITINPTKWTSEDPSNIRLGLYTTDEAVSAVESHFRKTFSNKLAVIRAAQTGPYGMSVTCTAYIGNDLKGAKASNLKLYKYSKQTNKYDQVNKPNIKLDGKGYVTFTTSAGDYLVVTDGSFSKK